MVFKTSKNCTTKHGRKRISPLNAQGKGKQYWFIWIDKKKNYISIFSLNDLMCYLDKGI